MKICTIFREGNLGFGRKKIEIYENMYHLQRRKARLCDKEKNYIFAYSETRSRDLNVPSIGKERVSTGGFRVDLRAVFTLNNWDGQTLCS
jgi:hypothetical protein